MSGPTIYVGIPGWQTPKGSGEGTAVKRKNMRNNEWTQRVNLALKKERPRELWTGPVCVRAVFWLPPLPQFHVADPAYTANLEEPDVDKLLRNIFDECTGLIYVDDKQVVEVCALKRWAVEPDFTSGCALALTQLDHPEDFNLPDWLGFVNNSLPGISKEGSHA